LVAIPQPTGIDSKESQAAVKSMQKAGIKPEMAKTGIEILRKTKISTISTTQWRKWKVE
jgi:hypothetical protein